MSVKMKIMTMENAPVWKLSNGKHLLMGDVKSTLQILKSNVILKLSINLKAGFKCDGASVPKVFSWFLPQWDNKNMTYNMGAAIHDALYARKGFNLFTREECDDILRGIWRDSGIGRFKAGLADKCVEFFAGGRKHWGNDDEHIGDLVEVDF